ncbi:MAG: patched family protein, partial [Siphonobacter aquaeclarae]|nr:patched family protein [Siphonobacter aquaeclarae]
MWRSFARWILSHRIFSLVFLAVLVGFMGFLGTRLQLSYQIARVLPLSDSTQIEYERFKQRFGADGTSMVIGFQDEKWFSLPVYQAWYDLTNDIKSMHGVREVLSSARVFHLQKTDSSWALKPLITARPSSQADVDTLKKQLFDQPFYEGVVFNPETRSTLMVITFNEKVLNSKERIT